MKNKGGLKERPTSKRETGSFNANKKYVNDISSSLSNKIKQNLHVKALKNIINNKHPSLLSSNIINILKSISNKQIQNAEDSDLFTKKNNTSKYFFNFNKKNNDANIFYSENRTKNNEFDSKIGINPKKNLLPTNEIEEILENFLKIEKIENKSVFFDSLTYVFNEIILQIPTFSIILKKLHGCYEKLFQESIKSISSEDLIITLKSENEKLILENSHLSGIFDAMKKRGFDFEKLFEMKWKDLILPKTKINFNKIKMENEDSEEKSMVSVYQVEEKASLQKDKPGFKIDLSKMNMNLNKENHTNGFHEEFMAKVNEFSESWREAAQREHGTISKKFG